MKKQPLIGIITDPHLKHGNEDLVKDIFNQFISLLKAKNLELACLAGDMFTERQNQNIERLTDTHHLCQNKIFDA